MRVGYDRGEVTHMKTRRAFAVWLTLPAIAFAAGAGFLVTKAALSHVGPTSEPNRDRALLQAKMLLNELQDSRWDASRVSPKLLRLPEQDFVSSAKGRRPERNSFAIELQPEYDEVAFTCDTFVDRRLDTVKGVEGKLVTSGYYIVGWKDGHVSTVDVHDVRLFELPGKPGVKIAVFPGMSEYSASLQAFPGTERSIATVNGIGG